MSAGSGLVIQCLARFQRTPRRASARRRASPLTGRAVSPAASAVVAASAKVHWLVGWPQVRGLWCRRVRNCSRRAASKAAWGVRRGAEERRVRTATPWVLQAAMTWRTV
jgi:hypothetical protein